MKTFKFNNDSILQKIQTINDKKKDFDVGSFEKHMKQTINYVKSYDKKLDGFKDTYNQYKESLELRVEQETDHNLRVMEGKFER